MCFTWDFWSPFLSLRNVSKRTPFLMVSHHPLYRRFQVCALPSLTSCEWGLSVSRWSEVLVCVSRSRTALDYVWMGDIRGGLNCGDVCASHFRTVVYCICTSHSKDTLLALVLVHTAGEVGFALSHSQRSFVPVSRTLRVATRGQQL